MAITPKTVIVTGGSQGIGSAAVRAFLDRGYNAVATSRNVSKSKELPSSSKLALVDGDIGEAATAAKVYPVHARIRKSFGSMTRKLSVTESQSSSQFCGTSLHRKLSTSPANSLEVA
jgi:NAD(P)-dependent dehydrogenase (short-subunit alcohol dehydrogenase family)